LSYFFSFLFTAAREFTGASANLFAIHKFPDAIHPGVASRSGSGLHLEAMMARGESVKIALDAHSAHLLPKRPTSTLQQAGV
jgi:hypothetical protein